MERRNKLDQRRAQLSAERRALLDRHVAALYDGSTMRDLAALVSPPADQTRAPQIQAADRAVAIVGAAARAPGAPNLDQLWINLRDGVESIRFFDADDPALSPEERVLPGFVRAASVLDDIDLFDAALFGFSAREAELLDPQLRILLECALEALDNAGYSSDRATRPIGLFAGGSTSSYLINIFTNPAVLGGNDPLQIALGNDRDALTTTISYKLNLSGPSVNVQTFCSTSLVAVHLARSSLLAGECELALAGGVSLNVVGRHGYVHQPDGIWSPDGHCRAFDARAQGTIFGEGAGLVVLKRLNDALRDRDTIHAVILGSAINNDGSMKTGYTAPSIEGQAQVIRRALEDAGVGGAEISYVEAHGTGTPLGDPIEIAALTRAFRATTNERGFCSIGSIKTNVGHLDRAAGISSLLKVVLSLKHEQIPASLHLEEPNPEIDFSATPFIVNTALSPWPRSVKPRRAGVTALGIGGTNAHVVLEEPPEREPCDPTEGPQLLVLSAKTESALAESSERLAKTLEDRASLELADVAFTLQLGRRVWRQRRAIVASDKQDAIVRLRRRAEPAEALQRSVVFVFPGQGAQFPGMGAEIYRTEPLFKAEIDRAAEIVERAGGVALLPLLFGDPQSESAAAALRQTNAAQVALFATELAMARLLIHYGLLPSAMIGHSVGEYVAATLAGVLSVEEALLLIVERAKLMQQLPSGAMISVAAPIDAVADLIGGVVSLAASNAPQLLVLSGPERDMAAVAEELETRGLPHNRLHTSHAFHSAMMDPVLDRFAACAGAFAVRSPSIPYVSNVTGDWIGDQELRDPRYWSRHLRETVRFDQGLSTIARGGERLWIEVGPGAALSSILRQHRSGTRDLVLASMRSRQDKIGDRTQLLETLGRAWTGGAEINFEQLFVSQRRGRVPLPSYPFERQRYWITAQKGTRSLDLHGKKADLAEWFCVPSWQRTLLPQKRAEKALWICFLGDELGEAIAQKLTAAGHEVVRVYGGESFVERDGASFELRPGALDDYRALFGKLESAGRAPPRILFAWPLSVQLERVAFEAAVLLVRAAAQAFPEAALELSVLTHEAQDVIGSENVRPFGATMFGISKVAPRELPNVRCRVLDLEPGAIEVLDRITSELDSEQFDPAVAYRGQQRWIEGFNSVRLEAAPRSPQLVERGVYVITGGLGGIGLSLAAHLFERAAARLVLLGRTPLPPREKWDETHSPKIAAQIRAVRALEQKGAEVLLLSADVADRSSLQRALSEARAKLGAIDGIIHAAGVAGGGIIQAKTTDALRNVTRPKIEGTINLFELAGPETKLFVLCSSIASVAGGFGQVDYVAANAFLDAFAAAEKNSGRRVVSLNWSAWNEVGMAVETEIPAELRAARALSLARAISPKEGAEAFDRALSSGASRLVIASQDLGAYFEAAATSPQQALEAATERPRRALVREALSTPYVGPASEVEHKLVEIWCGLLAVEPIGIDDNFFELGGNSLIALQLVPTLRGLFSKQISTADLFEQTTIRRLAAFLQSGDTAAENDDRARRGELIRERRVQRRVRGRTPET